ncbi:Flavin reductase domain protein FMN-binding protein [Microbacterium sp. C448]|uniref:flavin reductase family protein n=1 Tax=Microbacterium TaxID=33882 RepID=UPI0003DE2EF1|nr:MULTISPECIES: flavin reductase family protein [Microbacterium]MDO8381366.1 flavin reductase family protein [Microbacterium sp.]CDK01166.1 Flavin reductase domain protein FMN-binding protein [Microbacterium sp. C448]|tara:strand:+ start:10844 stop:11374 length:531 start_codon:yes stop_codon:yes gene_type:complete
MISPDDFKAAFRSHPAGVSLITADAHGVPIALTASSVSAVSADPPLLMFSVSVHSSSAVVLRLADTVVVHLLSAENLDLAVLGATSGIDRFADTTRWRRLDTGEPVFDDAHTWLRARILHRIDAGGSTVFVATAVESRLDGGAEMPDGLVYQNRTWHRLNAESVAHPTELVAQARS